MMRDFILWLTMAGGPIVWFIAFGLNWAMSGKWQPTHFVLWAVALLLTAVGAWAAWDQWRKLGGTLPGEAGGAIARARAMAIWGILINGYFFMLLIAQTLIDVILRPQS